MKNKKIVSLVICTIMLISMLPMENAFAEAYISWLGDEFTAEALYYDAKIESWIRYNDGYVSLYDKNGTRYLKDNIGLVTGISKDIILAEKGSKSKIIDKKGNVLKTFYDAEVAIDIYKSSDFIYKYEKDGTVKLYDSKLNKICEGYKIVRRLTNNLIVVGPDWHTLGIIDKTGKEVLPIEYGQIEYISDNRIQVLNTQSGYGIIDNTGNFLIPAKYSELKYFSDDLIMANNKLIIRIDGSKRFESQTHIRECTPSCIQVEKNRWEKQIVDFSGNVIFSDTEDTKFYLYSNCIVAKRKTDEKCAIYNTNGKMIKDFVYDKDIYGGVPQPVDKYDFIKVHDKKYGDGLIDVKGNTIIPCGKYEWFDVLSNKYIEVRDEKYGYGLIDVNGRNLIPCNYAKFRVFADDVIVAEKKNGERRILDFRGNKLYIFTSENSKIDLYYSVKVGLNGRIAVNLGNNKWRLAKIKYR